MSVRSDLRETLVPSRLGHDGPLPPLLVLLTLVTGLVDAASYLGLGHVFVANMTGNVVFLGFAIAGGPNLSIPASLVAIAAFAVGGVSGGRLAARVAHRGRLLRASSTVQLVLVAVAAGAALVATTPGSGTSRYVLIALLGCAMGVQNAVVRRLAVAELTTTVLTMTLTGIAADSRLGSDSGSKAGRRLIAVVAMFAGALAGAVLERHVDLGAPLVAATCVLAVVSVAAHVASRGAAPWAE